MTGFEDRTWRSRDGLTLFARDYAGAAGPARLPLVCLHGLTRNSRDFEEVAPRLAAGGRRVIVPDVRGRGRSDRDSVPDNYQPTIYARDILEMFDALGIARAQFLGTSMGGIIAMTVSSLRPGAVAGTILNDVGPEIAPEGVARILGYAGQSAPVASWKDAAAYVRRTNALAFPDYGAPEWKRFAERTFREGAAGPELDYDPAIAVPLSKPPPRWAASAAWMVFRRLARRGPVMLIRGATSDILTAELGQKMRRRAPSLQIVEVPGIGHAPMLTEPEAMAAIERFLADVP